jgi:thioredoxin-like negative regulator of GroEL
MGVLWAACGLFWLVSARNSHRWRTGLARLPKKEECDRRFAAAQEAYLKGHWPEAESQLRPLLEMRPDDIESRLLLATLLRRMGRLTDARSQLEEFARRSGSERWSLEFHREWENLKRLQKAAVDEPGDEDERAA